MTIEHLTVDECRERIADITRRSKLGDYSWNYDEYLQLVERVPEERAAREKAWQKHSNRVTRARKRLGM